MFAKCLFSWIDKLDNYEERCENWVLAIKETLNALTVHTGTKTSLNDKLGQGSPRLKTIKLFAF